MEVVSNFDGEPKVKPELTAPYVVAMKEEALKKAPGHERSFGIVFDEINRQAIDTFGAYQSEAFKGVSFSMMKLTVTPEMVASLGQDLKVNHDAPKGEGPQNYTYFIEPAFGAGAVGNAFSALDMGIDRYMRELPKVARALKHGEKPPKIDIYVLGSPISLGGKVTEEWVRKVNEEGFNVHGELYADFVQNHLPSNLEGTRVIIQGPSRGAITAERTFHSLPEDIKDHAQGLYDVPAGYHTPIVPVQVLKSINMAVGMGTEFGVRVALDETSRVLTKLEPNFFKDIAKVKNLPEDDKEQKSLKTKALLGELKALGHGTPPDPFERGYYRAPDLDSVNIKPEGLIWRAVGVLTGRRRFIRDHGNKMFVSTSRKAHNFPWKKGFHRWEQIMEYCES